MKSIISNKQSSLFFAWFVCAIAALFYTYEYLLRIEPSIMVHDLRTYFSLSAGGLGLLASMYYWSYTPLQMVVGLITDRFGARHVLMTAISLCIIGTWVFGATDFYLVAAGARFFIGIGSAFAFVGALKLAADWLPKKYFSFFVGLCTSLGMLGAMFGETAMSWIVEHLGWHPVIIDSLWLGLIIFAVFFLFVRDKKEMHGAHETKIINYRALGHALLEIIRSRMIWQAGFIGCALFLSLSLFAEQWGNVYMQKVLHVDAEHASIFVDMIFFGWFIGSPLHGYLSEKIKSRKRVLMWGSALSLVVFFPIIICPDAISSLALGILLFLFGFFSSVQINCFAVARDFVQTRLTATAVGFMNTCVMVGGMIIQPLYGFTLDKLSNDHATIHTLQHYSAQSYRIALLIIPVFVILAFIIACLMKESFHKASYESK